MTPALKAMAEAMVAEVVRQGERGVHGEPATPMDDGSLWINGPVDLEKVARAGLEALHRPELVAPLTGLLDPPELPGGVVAVREIRAKSSAEVRAFRGLVDAILKEQP